MRRPAVSFLIFLLTSLAAFSSAQNLDLSRFEDNKRAGQAFATWARGLGYEVMKMDDSGEQVHLVLNSSGVKCTIEVKASAAGIKKLVLLVPYMTETGNERLSAKLKLANKINAELNSCKISIDSDGDYEFEFILYTDREISPALFRMFMSHADFGLNLVFKRYSSELEGLGTR